ncbi:MAG: nucleotide exchange factor GrpE [Clostridiales bacterium]|nr:nucleotide exchange factor GrpE [Clostridiales bacterium]
MEGKEEFSCEAEDEVMEATDPETERTSAEGTREDSKNAGEDASAETVSEDRDAGTESQADETHKQEAAAESTQEEDSSADASGQDAKSEKGSFFRKKEKKDKKDEKIEELTDRVRRQMAEFDNYRKRTEKEKSQMFETGAKSIIEKILPVIDSFERGLAAVTGEEKNTAFADGMDKIYKQMMAVLEEAGVKPIEAEGKEFDPNLHNAVMHIEDEAFGENIIAEEFQKGYTYRDSVVRHSMVKVAN